MSSTNQTAQFDVNPTTQYFTELKERVLIFLLLGWTGSVRMTLKRRRLRPLAI